MSEMEREHFERLHGRSLESGQSNIASVEGVVAHSVDPTATSATSISVLALEASIATSPNDIGEEKQLVDPERIVSAKEEAIDENKAAGTKDRATEDLGHQLTELSKDFSIDGEESSEPFSNSNQRNVDTSSGNRAYTAQRGIVTAPDVEEGTYQEISDNELAVAIAIDENEDGEELEKLVSVHAVEYDPHSKPPLYRNRRFRLYSIGGCCIFLVLLVVLISVFVGKDARSGSAGITYVYLTSAPTVSPTDNPTNARENEFRSYFADEVSPLVFEQGTPLFEASNWILYDDPQRLDINNPRLLQRFMLAFWYYHTSVMGSNPWLSCNPPGPGDGDDCIFKEFGRGENDTVIYSDVPNSIRWMSSQNECDWQGVICGSEQLVIGLNIVGQNLTGTLPTEMRALPFLQLMQLHYNLFTGTLPPSYANFPHLLSFEVHGNLLTGEIPTEFYDQESKSLITLNLGDNALSGTLDSKIGQLTDLKGFFLFGNNMVGTIPKEIGLLDYLTYTRFTGNGFTGQIPSSFGDLPLLTEFWYNDNLFTGTIPAEFGGLPRMAEFRVSNNQLRGTIPPELFSMTRAQTIMLENNELTGTLPSTGLLQLTELIQLKVSRNMLTGTIPTELGDMPKARLVWLHLNNFTGPLPDSVCEANIPNGLNIIQADCLPLESPPNPCRCCSACCDRSTEVCLTTDNN